MSTQHVGPVFGSFVGCGAVKDVPPPVAHIAECPECSDELLEETIRDVLEHVTKDLDAASAEVRRRLAADPTVAITLQAAVYRGGPLEALVLEVRTHPHDEEALARRSAP